MSLFSRLDRVRNGRDAKDRDEGGMFGVPDLGAASPPADQGAAQSAPQNPVSVPANIPAQPPLPQAAAAPVAPPAQPETVDLPSQETASPFAVSSLPPQNIAAGINDEPEIPGQTDDAAQDLASLALGDSGQTDPVKESPFMSAIAPPVATSARDRLPTVQGPFKRPAMFDKDKPAESVAETQPTPATKQEPFVSDDTSLPSAAADVALPSIPAATIPEIAIPEVAIPEISIPSVAAPSTPAPIEPPPVKSPFDRLMAERVPVANPNPTVPPVTPIAATPPAAPPTANVAPPTAPPQASSRSSLLERLNARAAAAAATEQSDAAAASTPAPTIPAAPAPVMAPAPAPPVAAAVPHPAPVETTPAAPPVVTPRVPTPSTVAEAPLDRDAEIPDEYIPDAAPSIPAASPEPSISIPAAASSAPPVSIPAVAPAPPVTPPAAQITPPQPPAAPVEESLPSMPAVSATTPTAPSKPMAEQEPNEGSGAFSPQRPNPDTPLENFPLERMNTAETPGGNRNLASRTTGLRGFADRLAARESLDRDLQMPANEPAARPSGAELVRIDEEANLSEKEMKVRILYRQKHLIFDSVLGSIDPRLMQNPSRETLRPAIEKSVDGALREFNLLLDASERSWMIDEFVRETTDVGPLVPLLDDPGISKIIITGANDVSVEKLGRIERVGISFRDDDHLLSLVRRIAEMTGGRIDAKVPLLDRPLPDGSRIRAKVPPIAPQPSLTIEKSTGNPFIALKRMQTERTRGEALPYNQLRERIQVRLLREFEGNTAATANQEKLRSQVEEMIGQVILEERVAVTRAEKAALVMDLLNEIVGLGPLEPLLNDPDVDEVMVNGPYQIYVERKGKLEISNQRFRDNAHAMQVIERILAPLGRRIDEKSPMVDGRLRDGSRFNAVIPPLALGGPTMTIRKFARDPFTMTDLVNFGSLTREAAQFLHAAVEGRLNIIVSGGTGSGKTTTLNVLSSFIPASDRIITIEDAAELQLRQEHTIRLETRPANIEGVGEVAIRDLVRNALRMRPDRIVVGECRGGEALDMLQAMNTGHDGSLTTAHSNGPRDTLKRLETMVMMAGFDLPIKAIREQVAMAVQLIVHQERMRDGKRRITAITEIVGMEGDVITMQDLFRFEQERIDEEGRIHGMLAPTGLRPKNWDTMVDHGVELSMDMFQRQPVDNGVRSRMSGAR